MSSVPAKWKHLPMGLAAIGRGHISGSWKIALQSGPLMRISCFFMPCTMLDTNI